MKVNVEVECPVFKSFRVQQVAGMYDMDISAKSKETFKAELPDVEEDWQIGAIVGPSGSGKTTIARHVYGDQLFEGCDWFQNKAVIDCFGDRSIKEITQLLTAVGFSSPPAWVKPYHVLSNGQKFRCDLVRALAQPSDLVAFDEFTSVVDRTVAKIGSAAIAKAIRKGRIRKRFVAVTCHYDILDWLEADWHLDMATGRLERRRLWRPKIEIQVRRVTPEVWPLFRKHHYMSGELKQTAACFLGLVDGQPCGFVAVIHYPHPSGGWWKEHRTVVMPDFQGVGIGNALSDFVGSLFVATGKKYRDTTIHPGHVHYRAASPHWRVIRKPGLVRPEGRPTINRGVGTARTLSIDRLTMGFEYVGPSRPQEAKALGVL